MNEILTDEKKVAATGSGTTPDESATAVAAPVEEEKSETVAPVEEEISETTDTEITTETAPEPAAEQAVVSLPESETAEPVPVASDDESETAKADEPADAEPELTDEEPEPQKIETDQPEPVVVHSKADVIRRLEEIVTLEFTDKLKNEADSLKQSFYRFLNSETDAARAEFVAAGGKEEDFRPRPDSLEERLRELGVIIREKKTNLLARTEKILEENLNLKKAILQRLKELIDSNDDFSKISQEFRKLQQQWKEIKQIPHEAANELWKEYQHLGEQFYDLLKINSAMRDYDFKKNLEQKQALCELAEKLGQEKDAIRSFFDMQKLHQEWREIGPVAKEVREEIWVRFKKASAVINKNYQSHFEEIRRIERRNLEEKTALCEVIEQIDTSEVRSAKEWDRLTKIVLETQEKWKTIGFAPKKHNAKLFERFRAACDVFFHNKSAYSKNFRKELEANQQKKIALCEKAEALKDSQDWKETAELVRELQKEWKTIGQSPRKYSEEVWKRFCAACDHFFKQKTANFLSDNPEEMENLTKKRSIIDKIKNIDTKITHKEAEEQLRTLMNEWSETGFVPLKVKEGLNKAYRQVVNKAYDRLKLDKSERRLKTFKSQLNDIAAGKNGSRQRLLGEREKLIRTFERLKNDIQTYENNLGFLSVASKGGSGLVKEMNTKVESLKTELNLILKKIEVIDNTFDEKEKSADKE
jgi:DNA repair exonuclease SbcCD ATPase subunit